MASLSPRLTALVDALPLRPGMRVLATGRPGAAGENSYCSSHGKALVWPAVYLLALAGATTTERKVVDMKLAGILLGTVALSITVATALASQQSANERAVRAAEERERLAVLAEDTAALRDIWAPSFIVNNPQNEISGDRGVVIGLIATGRIRHARFDRRIEAIRIDGDVAIVMGGETVVSRVESDPAPAPIERRFSHVWRRSGERWQLIARHANRVPPP